jgi:hypothetical protein
MSDVRKVFITKEVSDILDMSPAYLIRVARELNFSDSEFRDAGKRNYLFSEEAIEKLRQKFNSNKK